LKAFSFILLTVLCVVWFGGASIKAETRIISYNVENLFDTQHDSLKNDSAFLPDGSYHWNYYRYDRKLQRIAQVITNIAGWGSVPIVGLCEVENSNCLQDLCHQLRRFHYSFVHYESPDERGVDVALLYDTTIVKLLNTKPLHVDLHSDYTRDILYVSALLNGLDTLHTLLCHLPSQLGGSAASDWKRKTAKQIIQQQVDSILNLYPNAKIVVMGDMNSYPQDDIAGMYNMMLPFHHQGQGTHKYQGTWSCLDQFYVSSSLQPAARVTIFSPEWLLKEDPKYLDLQPRRNFSGFRYLDGYSDHLPIILAF
jgi:predicted extracellular nuclease